jgi:hypothetical protein
MTGFGMLTFDIGGYTALFGKYRTKESAAARLRIRGVHARDAHARGQPAGRKHAV